MKCKHLKKYKFTDENIAAYCLVCDKIIEEDGTELFACKGLDCNHVTATVDKHGYCRCCIPKPWLKVKH